MGPEGRPESMKGDLFFPSQVNLLDLVIMVILMHEVVEDGASQTKLQGESGWSPMEV